MTTGMRAANTRIDVLAGQDEAQASRLDALARQDRAHATLLEGLAQRAQSQESTVRDVTTTLASLRETLAGVDAELVGLEDRLSASSSAYGQMGTRIDGLAGWVDGFRRAGLSGEAVADRLSGLADELRRVRLRVDSIRPVRATVRTTVGER
jgi:chromosome segregation ATPase